MLATLGLLLVSQLNAAPPAVCSAAESRAALSVSQTITLLDVTLAEPAPLVRASSLQLRRPSWMLAAPPRAKLSFHFPRFSLRFLLEIRLSLGLSISHVVSSACRLAMVGMPLEPRLLGRLEYPVVRPLDLGPRVELSRLAPWTTLLARLGEDPDVSGRVSVTTGVSMGTTMGGAGTTVRNPAIATTQPAPGAPRTSSGVATGPRLSTPTFSVPSVRVPATTRGIVRR